MNSYKKVDWEKTMHHIRYLLKGRTYAKCFSEIFGVSERAAEYKLMSANRSELTVDEMVILANYFGCDIMDLLVFDSEACVLPDFKECESVQKRSVEHLSADSIKRYLEIFDRIDESYEIKNISEFLLYLPLIEDEALRDVVFRCYGNLEWKEMNYVKRQLTHLYKHIPDSEVKRNADDYRDNVLRVKGEPQENSYGIDEESLEKAYYENLVRYLNEGNSNLYENERIKKFQNKFERK